jgi:hypothetical protein
MTIKGEPEEVAKVVNPILGELAPQIQMSETTKTEPATPKKKERLSVGTKREKRKKLAEIFKALGCEKLARVITLANNVIYSPNKGTLSINTNGDVKEEIKDILGTSVISETLLLNGRASNIIAVNPCEWLNELRGKAYNVIITPSRGQVYVKARKEHVEEVEKIFAFTGLEPAGKEEKNKIVNLTFRV